MKNYIAKLSKQERKELIHNQLDTIKTLAFQYSITIETVQNLIAKNYLAGGDDTQLEKMLAESQKLAAAKKAAAVIRPDFDLTICNHAVIVSLLAGKEVKEKDAKNAVKPDAADYDGVHWDADAEGSTEVQVKWFDVLYLSAVYTAISEASHITGRDCVDISIDRVFQMLYPARKLDKYDRVIFLRSVRETMARFAQLSGFFQQSGSRFPFDGDFFFDGDFDSAGMGTFRKSCLQELTEAQKRQVIIRCDYLKGKRITTETQALKTYLIYRHEIAERPKAHLERTINVTTMAAKLGFPIQRSVLKRVLTGLQEHGLFHGAAVTQRSISWQPKTEIGSTCYLKLNDANGAKVKVPVGELDAETMERNSYLNTINSININAKLTLAGKRLDRTLFAIYKGDFEHGGRLYTTGTYGYQALSGAERQQCLIDGAPVCEVDFSCLHPRMLYAAESAELTGDAYDFYPSRPIAKTAMQIVINSPSRESARLAIAKELNPGAPRAIGSLQDADALIAAIEKRHQKIRQLFFQDDLWGKLQLIDSRIIITALKTLADAGIPAYPIHDSILCRITDLARCIGAMRTAYEAELSAKPVITVTMQGVKMTVK